MKLFYRNKVVHMDCIRFLDSLSENSIDSAVTDPPYALSFMGVAFDCFKEPKKYQEWCTEWGFALKRVLKPGAHVLSFGSPRTYHRLACGLEDAGFEIRDTFAWIYGSGFPKGMNVSKAIEKKLGVYDIAPEISIEDYPKLWERSKTSRMDITSGEFHSNIDSEERVKRVKSYMHRPKYPVSFEGKRWFGWNTALKPAYEPIVLARKPISEKTIVDNILTWGTGAINIDACRIAVDPDIDDMLRETKRNVRDSPTWRDGSGFRNETLDYTGILPSGRYPANLVLSHAHDCTDERCSEGCPVRMLNEQSGRTKGGTLVHVSTKTFGLLDDDSWKSKPTLAWQYPDSGGAARFFYCAKPSERERNAGLEERNTHITIKPVELIRYLLRLITPKNGITVDCFLGSGTTAIAAELEGFSWYGCDNNEAYCDIAKERLQMAQRMMH